MPRRVRAAKSSTYVRVARSLATKMPGGLFSSAQVAYLAHRRSHRASEFQFAAEDALRASGQFMPRYQNAGHFSDILLFQLADGGQS